MLKNIKFVFEMINGNDKAIDVVKKVGNAVLIFLIRVDRNVFKVLNGIKTDITEQSIINEFIRIFFGLETLSKSI